MQGRPWRLSPSSDPELSSRDASTRLIETQEAFILSLSPFTSTLSPPLHHLHPPAFCLHLSLLFVLFLSVLSLVTDASASHPLLVTHPSPSPSLANCIGSSAFITLQGSCIAVDSSLNSCGYVLKISHQNYFHPLKRKRWGLRPGLAAKKNRKLPLAC